MTDFAIVAAALLLFLCLGMAMGALLIVALSRRRGSRYRSGSGWEEPPAPPGDEGKPPRWPGR